MPVKITIDLPDHKEVLKRLGSPLGELSDDHLASILPLFVGGPALLPWIASAANSRSPTVSITNDQGRKVEFPTPIVPVGEGIPLITAKFMQGFMDRMRTLQAR
jgi:hypothetical protein